MNDNRLWEKKTKISYFLAVLIVLIHFSALPFYENVPLSAQIVALFFHRIINVVGVPLFFIISGAVFFRDYTNDKYIEKMKKRFFSLIIPYLLWNTINMVYSFVLSNLFSSPLIQRRDVITPWNVFEGIFHYKYNGPFWFVFALIIFNLCSPIVNWLVTKRIRAIICIFILVVLCELNIGLPVPLFHDKQCIVYYLVGAFVGKHFWDFFTKRATTKQMVFCCLGIGIAWGWEFVVEYWHVNKSVAVDIVILIIFSFSLWYLFDVLGDRISTYRFMGHSFWVYAIHMNLCGGIGKIMYLLFPKSYEWAFVVLGVTVLMTLVIIEMICIFMEKVFPIGYRVLSGRRG